MSEELNTTEAKIFDGPMTIISSAAQGKGKRKSKQWTLGGLYFANIERYSALLVNVRKIFVTIFVDRPMLVKQNSTFSEMSVSFFGTVRRPFTKLGISQETSRDLRHSSLTTLFYLGGVIFPEQTQSLEGIIPQTLKLYWNPKTWVSF